MGQRLAGDEAHHHAADQPGPRGRRDRIDLIESQPGILERRRDQRLQRLDMRTRRDFGHDAPEGRMRRLLPRKSVAEHLPIAGDERGGGFVARRFEAEDDPGGHGRPSIAPHGGCRRVGVWAWLAAGLETPSPFAVFGGSSLSRREREGGAQRRKGEGVNG
ncbi:hypothetical protein WR25_24839 [Diploscapter pachys]|uniref:Uncharacterized protein n=1 Tax=Diploscapter pachys TaxID=2018661 RepID=A0A2A2M4J5_9BILA|nr:hypothetical protein WR25_24839 [Diploscapter pachys]